MSRAREVFGLRQDEEIAVAPLSRRGYRFVLVQVRSEEDETTGAGRARKRMDAESGIENSTAIFDSIGSARPPPFILTRLALVLTSHAVEIAHES